MIDFITNCTANQDDFEYQDFNTEKVKQDALTSVLPLIIKDELTERQNICLRLFYIYGKNQKEIAKELGLSQPTVCRHIATAKAAVNKTLKYCMVAVANANDCWIKSQSI